MIEFNYVKDAKRGTYNITAWGLTKEMLDGIIELIINYQTKEMLEG